MLTIIGNVYHIEREWRISSVVDLGVLTLISVVLILVKRDTELNLRSREEENSFL